MQIVLRFYAQFMANQKKDFVKRDTQLQLACNATKYRFQPLNYPFTQFPKGTWSTDWLSLTINHILQSIISIDTNATSIAERMPNRDEMPVENSPSA